MTDEGDSVPTLAAPATRDVREVVEHIRATREELKFHVERLKGSQFDGDAGKQQHARNLIIEYLRAHTALGRLYGYHMARLAREEMTGSMAPVRDEGIDARGTAAPHVTEEEV